MNIKIERKNNNYIAGVFLTHNNVYHWKLINKNRLIIVLTDDILNININYAVELIMRELKIEDKKISVFFEYLYVNYVKYYKRFPLNYSILDHLIDSFYRSKLVLLINLLKNSSEFREFIIEEIKETNLFKFFSKKTKI